MKATFERQNNPINHKKHSYPLSIVISLAFWLLGCLKTRQKSSTRQQKNTNSMKTTEKSRKAGKNTRPEKNKGSPNDQRS